MSKTPYEVRLDVLKMAQDMLESELKLSKELYKEKRDRLVMSTTDEIRRSVLLAEHEKTYPVAYNGEMIREKAKPLYGFVETSK